jgi:IclR family mhp operon transcriptional activator
MESTRPIRALTRGLDALTVLNSRDGATVSEIAQEIRLPRTTVYRILETLSDAGFAFRDGADDRYRLTRRVRSLSLGFSDEPWVPRIAKPCIAELCREIAWPVSVATLSGTAMVLRETTDHTTPLAIVRHSAGIRTALLSSAAGRVYLAFCPGVERDSLLELLAQSNKEEDKPARTERTEVQRMLSHVATEGYASVVRTRRMVEEASVSVPVMLRDRVLAALTVRCVTVPLATALERFLPKMRQCAARIGTLLSEHQAQTQPAGAPGGAA